MSGRLIILPKKTYTPWNPSNIERVLRDERIEKERVEKEEEEAERAIKLQRIQQMKQARCNGDGSIVESQATVPIEPPTSDDTTRARARVRATRVPNQSGSDKGHINFFHDEEKKMVESKLLGKDGWKSTDENDAKSNGIMPVFLSDKKAASSDHVEDKPFYTRKDCLRPAVDDRVKSSMDPMKEFIQCEQDSPKAKKPKTRSDRHDREDKEATTVYSDSSESSYRSRSHKSRKKRKRKEKKRSKRYKNDRPSGDESSNGPDDRRSVKKSKKQSKSRLKHRKKRPESDRSSIGKESVDDMIRRKLLRERKEKEREEELMRVVRK